MGDKQSVYIVEDDASIRELEIYALKNSEFEVTGFESGKSLMAQLEIKVPDIILLDIMLPEEDGLAILGTIRQTGAYADIPVIMVTAKTSEIDAVKGLDLGADDYITKPFNILEVKARIKAIMRRSSKRATEDEKKKIFEKNGLKIDCDSRRVFVEDKEVKLTAKEYDLLELLSFHPNKVYSRENLLNIVWGYDYPGDVRTVDVHIRRLREKIEKNPGEPLYIHTKWGVGYYFQD